MRSCRWPGSRAGALSVVVTLGVAAALLAGGACSSEPNPKESKPPNPGSTTSRSLAWHACHDGLDCGHLAVPLDESHPDGRTIDLALIRRPARDRDHRIGSLVVNPGGPGASGVDFVADAGSFLPAAVLDRFDLVGFDPRGVGRSAPIECHTDLDAYFDVNPAPETQVQRAAIEAASATVATACAKHAGTMLPYVSTEAGARDLDRLRAALGDPQLTYLGYSYGTLLGALYAEAFPTRVRALVLDGAVDPAQDFAAVSIDQAAGFQHIFDAYLAGCPRRSSCRFPAALHVSRARDAYDALWRRVVRAPIPADDRDGRALTPGLFQLGIVEPIYLGTAGFRDLDRALSAAATGNGARMIDLADEYTGRDASGHYDNSTDAYWAVTCLDTPSPRTATGFAAVAAQAAVRAPDFGPANVYLGQVCQTWAAPPERTPGPIHAEGAAPIVVIGGTRDPATPYANAVALAGQLESGRLVTVETTVHTSYPAGDDCLDPAINRYLIDRVVPRRGLRCG